jgi:ubiquinone/menaquinone biosynthesis C-methylase UbiE
MDAPNGDNDTKRRPGAGGTDDGVQTHVNTYFESAASYWDDVYLDDDLQGLIYRQRQSAVLAFVDAAALRPNARVLEIGCGAGHLTVALAERHFHIEAVDASQAMVDTTARRVDESGYSTEVNVAVADVHALPFEPDDFDLVVAVGVIPWLHSPADAVEEMARVLRPSGHLILTADNGARLTSFIDPREILARTPLKRVYHALRKRHGVAMSRLDFPRRIDRLLRQGGLRPVERRTVGFGPFSFWRRSMFRDPVGIRINDRLQTLADRGTLGLRWTGWHYVVRAAKPGS